MLGEDRNEDELAKTGASYAARCLGGAAGTRLLFVLRR